MDILIFDDVRIARHSTKTNKQILHDLKNQCDFNIWLIFKFSKWLKKVKYCFKKDLPFTLGLSVQYGVPNISIIDDDQAGLDRGEGWNVSDGVIDHFPIRNSILK